MIVVKGGNSAGQAGMNLARFAKTGTVIIRGTSLKSTLSRYLVDRIGAAGNIRVICNSEVTELRDDQVLRSVTLTDRDTRATQSLETKGAFYMRRRYTASGLSNGSTSRSRRS